MSTDLIKAESAKLMSNIENAANVDEVLLNLMAFKQMAKLMREWSRPVDEAVIEWMERNGVSSLPINETSRYYVGTQKKVTCRSLERTLDAALTACNGDLKRFTETLAKNAFKQGAVKELVGKEKHAELFRTEEVEVIKEGKAEKKKVLALADERYTR